MSNDISLFIAEWASNIQRAIEASNYSADELRALVRKNGSIRQIFVLDSGDEILLPDPIASDLSNSEKELLKRIEPILQGGELLEPVDEEPLRRTKGRSKLSTMNSFSQKGEYRPKYRRWHAYFWEQGLQPIYLFSSRDGNTVGIELERVRLIAELIAYVEDSQIYQPGKNNQKIDIRNHNGEVLHQWGEWKQEHDLLRVASSALPPPLGGWTINYYDGSTGGLPHSSSTLFNIVAGLTALITVLVTLTALMIREQQRQFDDAEKRVSFVNQVSHELKTPLTNIRMYAELLEQRLDEEKEETELKYLSIIVDESQRLSRLIENVLTFRKTERQSLTIKRAPANVLDIVLEVVEQFSPSLQEKGITPTITPAELPTVMIDRDLLHQILGNLLSNVEKYAKGAKRLMISIDFKEDTTTINVTDDGPGVPDHIRESIFEPFVRGDASVVEGVSGSGIGLSIAQTLAVLHGGSLSAKRNNGGAQFQLTISTPILNDDHASGAENEGTHS
jgi:signal transduction histidine kinase